MKNLIVFSLALVFLSETGVSAQLQPTYIALTPSETGGISFDYESFLPTRKDVLYDVIRISIYISFLSFYVMVIKPFQNYSLKKIDLKIERNQNDINSLVLYQEFLRKFMPNKIAKIKEWASLAYITKKSQNPLQRDFLRPDPNKLPLTPLEYINTAVINLPNELSHLSALFETLLINTLDHQSVLQKEIPALKAKNQRLAATHTLSTFVSPSLVTTFLSLNVAWSNTSYIKKIFNSYFNKNLIKIKTRVDLACKTHGGLKALSLEKLRLIPMELNSNSCIVENSREFRLDGIILDQEALCEDEIYYSFDPDTVTCQTGPSQSEVLSVLMEKTPVSL